MTEKPHVIQDGTIIIGAGLPAHSAVMDTVSALRLSNPNVCHGFLSEPYAPGHELIAIKNGLLDESFLLSTSGGMARHFVMPDGCMLIDVKLHLDRNNPRGIYRYLLLELPGEEDGEFTCCACHAKGQRFKITRAQLFCLGHRILGRLAEAVVKTPIRI